MNKRLTHAQRDLFDKQDAPYLRQPLVLGQDSRSASAHIRHIVRLLRSTRSASPCSDAMAHLSALYQRTVTHVTPLAAQAAVACKKGCSHCCAQAVTITAADAFHIVRALRAQENEDVRAAVQQAGRAIQAAPRTKRLADMRCPMLVDNACSVYQARPLACQNFASFSLNACITKFMMQGNADILQPAELGPVSNACRMILYAAFGLIGRADFTANYEMKAALAVVLAMDEGAEGRWLAGEDVMAGVDPLPDIEAAIRWDIGRMINLLRATV